MGYTTEFEGSFGITPNVLSKHEKYINKFSDTRRMKRNSNVCETYPDKIRLNVNLPIGNYGEYFVGGTGYAGQDEDSSILDYNAPPPSQPGLWCQWIVEDDQLIWNGMEKFYDYTEWLKYLIEHFFKPWGYNLNGTVEYQGEDSSDFGMIIVENNVVKLKRGKKIYE